MLSLSSDAITAIRQNAPTHIRIQFAGNSTIFDDNDVAYNGGVEIEQILNPDNDLTVGKAVSAELKLHMLNTSRLIGLDWSQPVTIRLGVEVNGDIEYCSLGIFNGTKPDKTELVDVIEFIAYDNMCKFDVEASDFLSGLNWSNGITVYSLLSRICSYVGVPLATLDSNYILSNIMSRTYTSNPIGGNGYTCRDVVAWIAEANCCYARINPAGALELVWYNSGTYSTETISRNDWFSLDQSEEECIISALKVYMSEEDIGVVMPSTATVTTKNLYRIFDNPFLSTGNSTEEAAYITPIYNRLIGFTGYNPISVTADGHWYLETGDIIKVEITDGAYARMPIFVKSIRWNGSVHEGYQNTGNGERETITKETGYSLNLNGRIHEIKQTVDGNYELIQDQFGNYYTKTETATQITTQVHSAMGNYYTKTETDSEISTQMGTALGNYYTKTETASQITTQMNTALGNYYTKTETASQITTQMNTALGNYYTKTETASQITTQMNTALGNYYTKTETANLITSKIGDSLGNYSTTSQMSSAISAAVGNCYGKVSGITITEDGITMTGNDYIQMGTTGYVSIDKWKFDQYGISYSNDGVTFNIDTEGTSGVGFYCSHPLLLMSSAGKPAAIYESGNYTVFSGKDIGNGKPLLSIGISDNPVDQVIASYLYYTTYFGQLSSREYKHDINSIKECGEAIDKLRPVTFIYNSDKEGKTTTGFIYEETVDIMPYACNFKDGLYTVNNVAIIPYLVKEIQSLRKRVKHLENRGNRHED